jgi:hypothetical protein
MKYLRNFSLLFFALLAFSACKEDKPDPAVPAKTRAELYFSAKLNGTDYLVEALVNGYGSGVAAPSGSGVTPGTYEIGQTMVFMNMNTQEGAGITVVKVFNDQPTQCSEIEPLYHTGKYTFGREGKNNIPAQDGVVVYYVDANKTYWSTDQGSGDQTGSNLEILEHNPNYDNFSLHISKVKFNCKLYDGKGNTIVLTDGETKGRSVTCAFL